MTYRQPQTEEQAFVEAFYLELIASGAGEKLAAKYLAHKLAADLDPATIEMCRAAARGRYEAELAELLG